MVHEKQPKLSAVDRLNEANSGYLADLEHKVLKLPSFETIDQAKTAALGIMNMLHDGAEISDGQILLMTAAVEELKEKGFSFQMDTAAYTQEGRLKNIYLDGEFGGFAIHIMEK